MIKPEIFIIRLSTAIITLFPVLFLSTVFAHSGHNHAEQALLTDLLHTLTTHPLLFGLLGLLLFSAMYCSRR